MVMSDKMLDSLIENSFYKGFDSGVQTVKSLVEKEFALLRTQIEESPELASALVGCAMQNILHEIKNQ